MLPKNHVLRKDYAKEFGKDATLVSYATLGKPAKRKRQEALDSAARVLKRPKDKAVRKEESFVTTTPFARLPYHDVTKHCLIDLAHTIGNLVKLLLGTVVNITSKNVAIRKDKPHVRSHLIGAISLPRKYCGEEEVQAEVDRKQKGVGIDRAGAAQATVPERVATTRQIVYQVQSAQNK